MARHEADREDLFAEAVALTRRLQGWLPECPHTTEQTDSATSPDPATPPATRSPNATNVSAAEVELVAGFRADGALSVYLGPERVYHCDAEGRLRRAFLDGVLYRTQGGTLAALRRDRTTTETTLWRHDLPPHDLETFHRQMRLDLQHLHKQLTQTNWHPARLAPADDAVLVRDLSAGIVKCLTAEPWLAPAIPTRRR